MKYFQIYCILYQDIWNLNYLLRFFDGIKICTEGVFILSHYWKSVLSIKIL